MALATLVANSGGAVVSGGDIMQTDTTSTTVVIIREGDRVVLKREDLLKAVRVERHRKVNFEKKWFFVDSLIGARYGTTFDITGGGDLQPQCASKQLKAEVAVSESGVDNRNIQSDGSAQKLTRDDISALKEQGLRGTEIVSQLVENSSTFKEKTEFSQEKYIKRKKKKYESHITVLKPNARLLATMYHSREPAKICHLRVDSLSQLLASGNVRASGKTIVVESCSGLVLGAVMERMGGHGTILNVHAGAMANTTATEHFGFPEHFFARVFSVPLDRIGAIAQQCCDGAAASNTDAVVVSNTGAAASNNAVAASNTDAVAANNTAASNNAVAASNNAVAASNTAASNNAVAASNTATVVSTEGCWDGCVDDSGMDTEAPAAGNVEQPEKDSQQAELDSIAGEQAGKRQGDVRAESETGMANVKDLKSQKEVRQEERKRCADIGVAELARRDADGLIIACKFQPWPILEGLLDFVSPSRPFVVFCQHREPLLECYTNLKERGSTVSLHLTESWLRFYQALRWRLMLALQRRNPRQSDLRRRSPRRSGLWRRSPRRSDLRRRSPQRKSPRRSDLWRRSLRWRDSWWRSPRRRDLWRRSPRWRDSWWRSPWRSGLRRRSPRRSDLRRRSPRRRSPRWSDLRRRSPRRSDLWRRSPRRRSPWRRDSWWRSLWQSCRPQQMGP
ncbi:tRNA (adenine(58)-N(1))-methyltransferase non-catalytic subunit TRM6-like isoform X2 [Lampetra fluviatilis]